MQNCVVRSGLGARAFSVVLANHPLLPVHWLFSFSSYSLRSLCQHRPAVATTMATAMAATGRTSTMTSTEHATAS